MRLKYKIDCPVSVLTPGRGKKRMVARGWLAEIGVRGARILLNEPLPLNTRFTLDVHLTNLDKTITTIRFQSIVTRVACGPPSELTLSFLGKEGFIRGKVTEFREDSQYVRTKGSERWIN